MPSSLIPEAEPLLVCFELEESLWLELVENVYPLDLDSKVEPLIVRYGFSWG